MFHMKRYAYWQQLQWAKQQCGPLCFVTNALVPHIWRKGFTAPIRGGLPQGILVASSDAPR